LRPLVDLKNDQLNRMGKTPILYLFNVIGFIMDIGSPQPKPVKG
jgi:hypothetical protein